MNILVVQICEKQSEYKIYVSLCKYEYLVVHICTKLCITHVRNSLL